MRHQLHTTRRINYQKVLVAVYLTVSDIEPLGLYNCETNQTIGEAAGLSAQTVSAYLRELEANGVIEVFRPGETGVCCRVMVLKDHLKARTTIRHMRRDYGRPSNKKIRVAVGA